MKIRCFGARGSIPVSGPQFVRYGGETSCLVVETQSGGMLVLDAGTGARRLGLELARAGRRELTLVFSHAHWDHVQGLPFFKPLADARGAVRLAYFPAAQGDLPGALFRAIRPPLFPLRLEDAPALRVEACAGGVLAAEGVRVSTCPTAHPDGGVGLRLEEGGRSFVYLTDNELGGRQPGGRSFAEYADFCRGADVLLHDAAYAPEEYPAHVGWGHSDALAAARLAREARVGFFGLFHHDPDRTDAGVDALAARCREFLAASGGPACAAVGRDWEMTL